MSVRIRVTRLPDCAPVEPAARAFYESMRAVTLPWTSRAYDDVDALLKSLALEKLGFATEFASEAGTR